MLTKKETKGKIKETKIMRKGILIGIGIFVILLALAGTGSASSVYGGGGFTNCGYCHTSVPALNGIGSYFEQIHLFDGSIKPSTGDSCSTCHTSISTSDFSLTSNGSSYNSTHRYNATTLASVKLIGNNGCNNCHVDAENNDFNLSTGAASYLGSAICEDCHKAKYDVWSNTLHRVMLTPNNTAAAMGLQLAPSAGSWADISYVLVTKFELAYINSTGYFLAENDAYETETQEWINSSHAGGAYGTCGRCHTTGWNGSAVNALPGISGTFEEPGIGCERCHGAAGNGHQVTVNASSDLCIECHTGSHHGTGWEDGAHAPPAARDGATCSQCHSPFDKYQTNGSTSRNDPSNPNVACGVCHNIHDMTDSQYADTFTNGNFNATVWSDIPNAKLSFFNGTASLEQGTDVFDDLEAESVATGVDISTILCSKCHVPYHGLGHTNMPFTNLSHGRVGEEATCTDCHMEGANAKLGKGMMKNHANEIKGGASCGGAKCHGTSELTPADPLVGNGSGSMQKRFDEWGASAHNVKEVGVGGDGYNHYYGIINETTGVNSTTMQQPNCNKCHDPLNWNPGNDYNSTTGELNPKELLNENFKGVYCTVCHPLHDMGNWFNATFNLYGQEKAYGLFTKMLDGTRYRNGYTMVESTTELCGSCHASVRIGRSESGWLIGASDPNRTHGFPANDLFNGSWKQTGTLKFECTSCHYATMTRYENGTSMPQAERIRGHSFKVNATLLMNNSRDCYTCHITGSTLGNLSTSIENIQTEIHDQWNTSNQTVMDALVKVREFTGVNTTSRTKIAQAYWNIKLVSSDESWGVHNPEGTRKLLNDAVTLANEANSSLGQATSNVDLITGWNLVALSGTPSVNLSKEVLSSVSSNITVVWGYNASASNPIDKWELYDPVMELTAPEFNDLKTIVPGKGYWIYANVACKWTV
ncbi:MAG: ammonia-forming cytochrome c nitrite reductase subunit c552 [Candidatus Methanoperedens sp.]|nr:ammonia-forming cytochrome c nitrite reductase subunit c552 [Candidatus Methanoperedens sp.]